MKLLDYLLATGLARNSFEARGLILSGKVLVNDLPAVKTGMVIKATDTVRLREKKLFVARSAAKLAPLIELWQFPVAGATVADIGSATGGFTQVLLQAGAARVLCIDVGYGLLAEELRRDPRVIVMERTNILNLEKQDLPFAPQHFTADVSFISLRLVLPKLSQLRQPGYSAAALLFKPQFELKREETHLLDRGILRDTARARDLLEDFLEFARNMGWSPKDWLAAPIRGRKGNQEYFVFLEKHDAG